MTEPSPTLKAAKRASFLDGFLFLNCWLQLGQKNAFYRCATHEACVPCAAKCFYNRRIGKNFLLARQEKEFL